MIGKSDIDIRCVVDGTNLKKVLSIQLIRSNKTVMEITRHGITKQDEALENKIGATVNTSISNVMASYLHLEISRTEVRYPEDMGSYHCCLTALDSIGGLVKYYSQIVNITGTKKCPVCSLF